MLMKILHLIIDHQVVERTMGIYEKVFPGCNDFVIIDLYQSPIKHLSRLKEMKLINRGMGLKEGKSFDFSPYSHIVAHFMSMDSIDFIKSVPDNIHVCWEIYGWDLYDQFLVDKGIRLYYTNKYKYSKYFLFHTYAAGFIDFIHYLKGDKYCLKYQKRKQFKYIINRVDSIQYCCKYDAVYVENFSSREIPSYEIFNYALSIVLGDLKDCTFYEGRNIMIGNSASFSNNHLYVLDHIKELKVPSGLKIILPLSYGGIPQYSKEIVDKYTEVFSNNNITILKDYLPIHEYNQILASLNSIVLSAWRQESQGTAIMGFYLGIKVVMSERSPLYKWFKEIGFIVFTIENINIDDLFTPLSMSDKKHNRNIVIERYSDEVFERTLQEKFK